MKRTSTKPSTSPSGKSASDTIILRFSVKGERQEQDWSVNFLWPRENSGNSPVWIIRIPRLKNPVVRIRRVAEGEYAWRLRALSNAQPFFIRAYHPNDAATGIRELFARHCTSPTTILIRIYRGKLLTAIRHNNPS